MKAIVVKNNDFQTVGFEVSSNGVTLFKWGISPLANWNWIKEVNGNDWMPQIFELVKLKGILEEQDGFCREFFSVAGKNNMLKEGQGVQMGDYEERINRTKLKMENIIKNIS